MTRRILALLLALLPATTLAQAPAPVGPPAADPLRVFLATYGPGEQVWEKFGHNAIWIQDAGTGRTLSYNWGMFSFSQDDFIPRLIRGSMLYWMEARDAELEANQYVYANRTITLQELALTPAQEHELQQFVEWNARPANRFYNYHYYRDNCSTRVRDALDRVLGGALAAQLGGVATDETFRSHSLRLTAPTPLVYTGLELGLADSVDQRISAWEEAFVPMQLMRRVRDVQVADGAGGLRPLVLSEQEVYSGMPEPLDLPNYLPVYLLIGLLVGAGFALSGYAAGRPGRGARPARWALALLGALWSLLVGLFGTLVLLLWTSTGHTFTYGNENLFLTNPLSLLLVALVPAAVLGARRARRPALLLALVVAALALLGLLVKPLPGFDQMNRDLLALMIPAHLGLAAALRLYLPRDTTASA